MTVTLVMILCALLLSLASVVVVVKSRASEGQKWMLISTISLLVYISQLYFSTFSTSIEMIFATRKMIYSTSIFLVISATFGISYICDINIPKLVKQIYVLVAIVSLPLMWSINHHNYWFKSYSIVSRPEFEEIGLNYISIKAEYGSMFYIVNGFLLLSFLVWLTHAIIFISKKKGKKTYAIRTLSFCLFVPTLVWTLALFNIFPAFVANVIMDLGLGIAVVFFQWRYNLTETVPIAKEQVVESTNEGVIVLDRYGQYVYANKIAKKMFPIFDKEYSDKNEFIEKRLGEDKVRIKDKIIELHTEEVFNSGKRHGSIIWARDITEDELTKENLINLKTEADNANAAKSNFLANMSHEIRTPINAVLGYDEMILRESRDEAILHYAESIRESGQALLYIINDILDLSKVETGKMNIINVEYNIEKVLSELLTMIVPRATAGSNQIVYHVDSNIPKMLYGDEIRIRQVITNLLTNAVKYTDAGTIYFEVTLNEIENDFANIHVSVRDTGIGIKSEDLEDLFDAFKRVDEVKNRNIEGTGLGLNITASLLKLMDSELQVTSSYGEGSEFYFDIKQRVVSEETVGEFDSEYKDKLRNSQVYNEGFIAPYAKILVVDDNVLNIEVFKGLLKKSKIEITSATSGMQTLELLADNEYDLIFLDHKMPKMDGIETLHRIKNNPELSGANMKIIALTANAVLGARDMYIGEGFDDYLMKPVIGADLEKMIRKHLRPDLIIEVSNVPSSESYNTYEVDNKVVDSKLVGSDVPSAKNINSSESYDVSQIHMEELNTYNELINERLGMQYCGDDKEIFKQLVDIFKESGLDEELVAYYNQEDWDNYEVIAHSVKSNAKTIGAESLSEYAKAMEFALKYGKDTEFIKAHHDEFIAFYKKVVAVL